MSAFTFMPAVREQVSLLIALAGASGSGKTMSALRLAQGMAPSGKIMFIDTEARRGLHYADQFKFLHCDMRPPFSPARFLEVVRAAQAAGAEVIVIDNFSDEYEGEGGVIDMADAAEKRGVKGPAAWAEAKEAHKLLLRDLMQCRVSIIFCLRADEKIEIIKENGRTQVRPLGWTPVAEKRFHYYMTTSFTLTPDKPGIPRLDLYNKLQEQHRSFFPPGEPISEQSGRALAEWARGGAAPAVAVQHSAPAPAALRVGDYVQWTSGGVDQFPIVKRVGAIQDGFVTIDGETTAVPLVELRAAEVPEIVKALRSEGEEAASRGKVALESFWGRHNGSEKKAMGGIEQLARWKATAAQADAVEQEAA